MFISLVLLAIHSVAFPASDDVVRRDHEPLIIVDEGPQQRQPLVGKARGPCGRELGAAGGVFEALVRAVLEEKSHEMRCCRTEYVGFGELTEDIIVDLVDPSPSLFERQPFRNLRFAPVTSGEFHHWLPGTTWALSFVWESHDSVSILARRGGYGGWSEYHASAKWTCGIWTVTVDPWVTAICIMRVWYGEPPFRSRWLRGDE